MTIARMIAKGKGTQYTPYGLQKNKNFFIMILKSLANIHSDIVYLDIFLFVMLLLFELYEYGGRV